MDQVYVTVLLFIGSEEVDRDFLVFGEEFEGFGFRVGDFIVEEGFLCFEP